MVDCTDIRDFEFKFMTSHQYYRMSPQDRSIMAAEMAGPVVSYGSEEIAAVRDQ